MAKPFVPTIDRLLARIAIDDQGCWNYPTRNENGYGVIGSGGRGGKTLRTHRVTYEHFVGPIPDDLQVDHLCRNKACCNPDHLEPVTHRGNAMRGPRKRHQSQCINGHEFTPENTRRTLRQRVCLTCERARTNAYAARKRASA